MLQKQYIRSEDIYRFLIKVKSGAGETAQWVKCECEEHSADKQHQCGTHLEEQCLGGRDRDPGASYLPRLAKLGSSGFRLPQYIKWKESKEDT